MAFRCGEDITASTSVRRAGLVQSHFAFCMLIRRQADKIVLEPLALLARDQTMLSSAS